MKLHFLPALVVILCIRLMLAAMAIGGVNLVLKQLYLRQILALPLPIL